MTRHTFGIKLLQTYIQNATPKTRSIDYTMGYTMTKAKLGFRPLVLPVRNRLVDGLLSDLHCLHAGGRAAVDGRLQHDLPDLDLREAVVDGPAGVQPKLEPCLLGDDYSQVWHWLATRSLTHSLSTLAGQMGKRSQGVVDLPLALP